MRVFIFGIGGTGSRVLRSLTMLLASGVKLNNNPTIVPIVIDTDANNGDTSRTRDLLKNYYTVRKHFVDKNATSQSNSFFNTQIRSFNRLDATASDAADLDVQFNFQNQDNSFANFINYNGLSQPNKDLVELLYNDSLDDHPELHLNLSVGFKGNPNIGSVVFNDLMFSDQFKNIASGFTSTDRIFIVSSIFGGTGSSGFPTLVKLIRTSSNANFANAKIGAITIMPYFNVDTDDSSAINSAIFNTKTKAALSFYSADSYINSINALYYIADNNQPGSLKNVEGGKEQVNNSHLIELISASSIVDFIDKKETDLEIPQCYEFGGENDGSPFTIADFSSETKEKCIKPLVKFAYASKIATDFVPALKKETFYSEKELNIGSSLGIPNQYQKAQEFFKEFKKWSTVEMSSKDNGRAFNSFNFESSEHLNNMVHGKPIKTGIINSGLSLKNIGGKLSEAEVKLSKTVSSIPERYMQMLYEVSQDCLTELGQLP